MLNELESLREEVEKLRSRLTAVEGERLPKVDIASRRRDRRQVLGGLVLFAVASIMGGVVSASALASRNTVFSDDIVDGTVAYADIKDGALGGRKLLDSAVTSAKILNGTITSADLADNAITQQKIGSVDGGKIVDSTVTGAEVVDNSLTGSDVNESTLVLACATGLTEADGICFTPLRAGATHSAALSDCQDEGLRLPTRGEAELVGAADSSNDTFWVDTRYQVDNVGWSSTTNGDGLFGDAILQSESRRYHCITTVGARPIP